MKILRVLIAVAFTIAVLVAPALAEHSPHFDVECPTGSAQVVLDPGHGGSDPGAVNEQYGLL